MLMADLHHLDRREGRRRTVDLIDRFDLADAARQMVATYSGGMRRRLDLAMTLIGDPRIIFLDEPTTGLDPEGRLEVWQVIQDLASGGTTVLLTTQYLDEAEKLADRIAILHQGTIIVSGTLADLRKLLPPAKAEYVERQPTLEEIFLAITAIQVSVSVNSTRMPVTASHASTPAEERKPMSSPTKMMTTTEIMLATSEVRTCPHSTDERAIGIEWNLSRMPLCRSVNRQRAV